MPSLGYYFTRKNFTSVLTLLLTLCGSFMIYKGLGLVLNTGDPFVVVLSESMEPAFARGDIIFLANPKHRPYATGDILVYSVPGTTTPIVHRVLETHSQYKPGFTHVGTNGLNQKMLTKGDNNPVDDTDLYHGLEWLEREHIVGRVVGFLPYVGYFTIIMNYFQNDYPNLKYVLLGGMGLYTLINGEQ
ncbi:signal peptidase I [Flagelloscypha sp. PMI_526]|nr:signal peptidase I [Flagelloscypha sp. PMI_526]